MSERYAIYFAPAVGSELWRRAAAWLGRDALTGQMFDAGVGGLDPAHRLALTHSARRYGFHATLKAPLALAPGLAARDLDRALRAWAAANPPVDLGRLQLAWLGEFLALVPEAPSAALNDLAGRVVVDFDGFRAPLTATERQRRTAAGLDPRELELLETYGYPYVLDRFLFHMTLTDRLPEADREPFRRAADAFLAPLLDEYVLLDRLVVFHQAEAGAPFARLRDYPLAGEGQ
jgi:putative phosphonate metabolism protein